MSKRRKKKNSGDNGINDSWMLPYSDLLTLLVALFIVLFAMSSVDAQKFNVLSRAFSQVFTGGNGIVYVNTPSGEKNAVPIQGKKTAKTDSPNAVIDSQRSNAYQKDQKELRALSAKLNKYITQDHLTNKLQTSLTTEGLLVTIRDNVLFDSGSADVRKQDLKTAKEIANLLVMDPPRNIIISGHTDNVPIKNAKYESNWELSVMRAVNFMKIILQNDKLDPKWFSVKGFGEFQPIASNKTKEGRARNRRVEILISPRIQK